MNTLVPVLSLVFTAKPGVGVMVAGCRAELPAPDATAIGFTLAPAGRVGLLDLLDANPPPAFTVVEDEDEDEDDAIVEGNAPSEEEL